MRKENFESLVCGGRTLLVHLTPFYSKKKRKIGNWQKKLGKNVQKRGDSRIYFIIFYFFRENHIKICAMLLERMRNGWWGGGQLEVGMGRRYIYAKKSRISHGTRWKRAKSNQGSKKKPKFEFLRGNVVFRGVQSAFGGK